MYSKVNYTIVGVFVVAFFTGLIMFGFWLAKYGLKEKSTKYYLIYFNESVNGLSVDSSVKLNGVEVGKVAKISIDPKNLSRVKVLIKLKQNIPIPKTIYAVLNLQGITGLSYIELKNDSNLTLKVLKTSKEKYPVIPSRPSIATKLIDQTPQILSKISRSLDSFNQLLSKENIQNISSVILDLKELSKKSLILEDNYISLAKELNSSILGLRKDVNKTIKNLESITAKIDKNLDSLLKEIKKTTSSIGNLSQEIQKRVKRGQYDLKRIVRPIEVDIKELSYQYQELANSLKTLTQNPSSIIFGSRRLKRGPGE
jgi:phospholipid/cholesterol/gamma-HCH transport system substrate-binding protein